MAVALAFLFTRSCWILTCAHGHTHVSLCQPTTIGFVTVVLLVALAFTLLTSGRSTNSELFALRARSTRGLLRMS